MRYTIIDSNNLFKEFESINTKRLRFGSFVDAYDFDGKYKTNKCKASFLWGFISGKHKLVLAGINGGGPLYEEKSLIVFCKNCKEFTHLLQFEWDYVDWISV